MDQVKRKGIILAGGSGTRLHPLTLGTSKQLLPVYDKPMIYYPLSVLMLSGIRDIAIITTPEDAFSFQRLLGDGSQWGLSFTYIQQPKPEGLAQAFILSKDFLQNSPSCLILGDNIFFGHDLTKLLEEAHNKESGSTIFGYYVTDPSRYGVAEFDGDGNVVSLEEKPKKPKSNYAVTGLYYYDNQVVDIARSLKPSQRGELEITDLNKVYLEANQLDVKLLGRGTAWLDTGTHESLLDAHNFASAIEKRQGLKIACPEEIAWRMKFITTQDFQRLGEKLRKSGYGSYMLDMIEREG